MPLPKQIRDQIKEANQIGEAIQKELAEARQRPTLVPSSVPPPPESAPASEASAQTAETSSEEPSQASSEAPPATPEASENAAETASPEATEGTPAPAPATAPAEPWEDRYRTLRGMYDADVPRMAGELRYAKEEINALRQQIDAIRAESRAPESEPAARTPGLITDRDRQDFGDELVDFAYRAARDATGNEIDALRKQVTDLTTQLENMQNIAQSVQQRQANTETNALYSYLDNAVPSWREADSDPAFSQWLQEVDGFSGFQRGQLLRTAHAQGDAARVAHFFKAFEQTKASEPTAPSATPSAAPTTTQRPAAPVSLDTLTTPTPSSGAMQPTSAHTAGAPKKRTWTQGEIARHFEAVRRGQFYGREKEQRAIELDITAAQNEGRIDMTR